MVPYSRHTKTALQAEIKDIQNLLVLVKFMNKPENFTYMDVTNLHNHLEELLRCLQDELCKKEDV